MSTPNHSLIPEARPLWGQYFDYKAFDVYLSGRYPGKGWRTIAKHFGIHHVTLKRIREGKIEPSLSVYCRMCSMQRVEVGSWLVLRGRKGESK